MDSSRGEADDVGHPVAVHIGQPARIGVVAAPTARGSTEIRKFEGRCREMPISCGERNMRSSRGEADDVGHAVIVYVREFAWVSVVAAPTTSPDAKLRKFEGEWSKMTASGR